MPSLVAYDIPSKCRFDLIEPTLESVQNRFGAKKVAESTRQHLRHAYFLLQNGCILGFLRKVHSGWALTDSGYVFLESDIDTQNQLIRNGMIKSNLFSFLLASSGNLKNAKLLSVYEISEFLQLNTIVSKEKRKPIKKSTADRRAASVKGWLKWI